MPAVFRPVLTATMLTVATSAFAIDIPDSGRLLRESAPPPKLEPKPLPPKIVPPQQAKPVSPDGLRVKVTGFTFSGSTVFTKEELAAIMASYIGKELTLAELDAATAEITKAYRKKGYFLASAHIPPQTIKPGAPILVEIVEGVLEKVQLKTTPAKTRTPHSLLQRYLDRVPAGQPAEKETISGMVMRVNELPAIDSRIVLEPGSKPGTAQATLAVTEGKPYSISFDTDNYGSYATGYYRIGSTLELYSPLRLGDLFTLRAQTSFKGDTQTVQTGYTVPVSGSGTKIGFNYSFVTYELGAAFKALDASGTAHDFTLNVIQPLVRSSNLILDASVGGEGRLLDDDIKSAGSNNKRHTVAGLVGVNGVEMDTFLGGGSTSFSVNYTGGHVGIDDQETRADDQLSTGLHTKGGYSKIAANVYRNQNLYKAISLFTGINGQWASANLDSSEQFALGGPSGVRAFPISEASCDMGFVYTAELRYLFDTLGPVPGSLQLAAFVDHGRAILHDDPVASDNVRDLTGVGFGANWSLASRFNLRTSVAWRTQGDADGKSETNDPTVYFQGLLRF